MTRSAPPWGKARGADAGGSQEGSRADTRGPGELEGCYTRNPKGCGAGGNQLGRAPPWGEPVPSCASIGMWDEADLELPLLFLLLWLLMEWWDCSLR